jgi:hypothetical protein
MVDKPRGARQIYDMDIPNSSYEGTIIKPLINRFIHRSLPNTEIFSEVEGIDSLNSRVKTPLNTRCLLDTTRYPFDNQTCEINISKSGFHTSAKLLVICLRSP